MFKAGHTDINRRTCRRTVPVKIIVCGLSRTGTSSIRAALKQLGYNDVYHYFSVLAENPRDSDMWVDAFKAKFEGGEIFDRKDWDQLLGHCEVINDTPCNVFVEELLAAYPHARIILTVRDSPEQWYESYLSSLQPYWDEVYLKLGSTGWLRRNVGPRNRCEGMEWMLLKHTYYGDFRESGMKTYLEHNEKVRRLVKEQGREFLEFNPRQGWAPLCDFLGKEVPHQEYPRLFEGQQAKSMVKGMVEESDAEIRRKLLVVVTGLSMVAALAITWFASKS